MKLFFNVNFLLLFPLIIAINIGGNSSTLISVLHLSLLQSLHFSKIFLTPNNISFNDFWLLFSFSFKSIVN